MQHIDFDTVKKVHGNTQDARDIYYRIAKIAGGDPDPNHTGGMDLSGLSEAKVNQIKKLLDKPDTSDTSKTETKQKDGK